MSKSKTLTVDVLGTSWTVHMQAPTAYRKMHGSDSEAITYPGDLEVFFNKNYFTPDTVRHETMHLFVASSGSTSSSLTKDQMEELCAELYGQHGPKMDLVTDQIISFFSRKHVLK